MFFKKIEMTGFKSFASKTEVDFLPGVTVVVGPNGCGKSNIFDAIRWALGEQSPKSLRGQKMGDVIFNGSASQKPHSFAQVNLIINNQDKKIPIDFNEITVSRRLYRTGESEYYVNKTLCRLKDIYDIFMDTGVGTDSYSVMQQHQVDQIITSKPRERSYIFEEAAGISKYKARKEEALRKLLKTEEDLLRLNDLIIEVQKNVGSLKRAAAKAERYKTLHAEQVAIQMRHLYLQHKTVETQLLSIRKEFQTTIDKLNEITSKLDLLESQNEAAKLESENISRQINEAVSKEYNLSTEISSREHNINLLIERIKNLKEQKVRIEEELLRGKEVYKSLEQKKQNIESEYAEIKKNFTVLENDTAKKQNEYNTLRTEHEKKIAGLDEKRSDINRRISVKIKVENEKRFSETMVEKLTQELSEGINTLENLKNEVEQFQKKKNDAEDKIAELNQTLKDKRDEFEQNKKKLQTLQRDELSVHNNIEKLSEDIRKNLTRLDTLKELQLNYEGYYYGVKEVMKAADRKKLNGVVGIVAKLIELKKEHEAAIEAALGGDIQDIVTITVDDAKAAIEFLRRNDLGRATFLPLDFIEPPNLNSSRVKEILNEPGVIGLARELVKYDKSLQKVIEYLFADTVVVDDIEVAINLGKKGHRVRSVSLKGDLLNPRGVLTGGSHKSKGLLSRERELIATKKELERLQEEEKILKEKWENLKKEIRNQQLQSETIQKSIHAKEIQFASEKHSYDTINDVYFMRKKQLDQISQTHQNKNNEIEKYKNKIAELSGQISELEIEDTGLDEAIKEAENEIAVGREAVQKLQEEVNYFLISLSSIRERKTSFEEKVYEVNEEIQRFLTDEQKKNDEVVFINSETERFDKEIADIRNGLAKIIEERDRIKSQMSSKNQQHDMVAAKLKSVTEELQMLRREQNDYINKKHEQEVSIAQYETQNDNFINQASENFNQPLEEVLAKAGEQLAVDMEAAQDEDSKNKLTDREYLRNRINEIKDLIDRLGAVNPSAIDEYNEQKQRLDFYTEQHKDLTEAKESLKKTIAQIDETTNRMFSETFENIRKNFIEMFRKLFNGGKADLILVQDENQQDAGVDIVAQPPGKKLQNISLLSGGEKALTAIALLFAIFLHKPSPFCILDEIDAPLDDANVIRFSDMVKEFSLSTQFIIITHNKQTMSLADTIYGITMEEPGVSKLVSVKFEDIENSDMVVGK